MAINYHNLNNVGTQFFQMSMRADEEPEEAVTLKVPKA